MEGSERRYPDATLVASLVESLEAAGSGEAFLHKVLKMELNRGA